MSWPPYLLKLSFQNRNHAFRLWLPLFLIGPVVFIFLLAVFLILFPFALLTMIFTWEPGWLRSLLLSVPAGYRVMSQLHGLKVEMGNDEGHVHIEFR